MDLSDFEDSVPKEYEKRSSESYSVGSLGDSWKNDQEKKTGYFQLILFTFEITDLMHLPWYFLYKQVT